MISFKIDKELKKILAKVAKEENRSLSNLIETVLLQFAAQRQEDGKPK